MPSRGTTDTIFGTGREVTTVFGGITQAFGVAVHSDGRIVAAGGTFSPLGASPLLVA